LVFVCLGCLLLAAAPMRSEENRSSPVLPIKPPTGAQKLRVNDNVTLYHWTELADTSQERIVRIIPVVSNWPQGSWGAEVTMTPVPDCCGARIGKTSWRKSSGPQIRTAGTIAASSRYKLEFRFK
jgi:hypothetical protein